MLRTRVGFPYLTVDVDGEVIYILRGSDGRIHTEPDHEFPRPMKKEFEVWFDAYDKHPKEEPGLLYTRPPGTPLRVGLVACSKSKRDKGVWQAKDLYTGDLFKKARTWVEHHCDDWGILSAKHRLLRPWHEVEPYEQTLDKMDRLHREGWARTVNYEVYMEWGEETTYVLLCSELYRLPFEVHNSRELPFDVPMKGLGLGEQKQWLVANT